MPAVLGKDAEVFISRIKRVQLALVVLARHANQEVGKVHASLLPGEDKIAVELRDRHGVDLIGMKFRPELHSVVAQHL